MSTLNKGHCQRHVAANREVRSQVVSSKHFVASLGNREVPEMSPGGAREVASSAAMSPIKEVRSTTHYRDEIVAQSLLEVRQSSCEFFDAHNPQARHQM